MNANCVICSDSFDETNPVAATPCGHVYHTSCLRTWIEQSKTCPECRSRTFLKGIQKLYFNFLPKSEANVPDVEDEVGKLTLLLSEKEMELRASEQARYIAEKNTNDLVQTISRLEHKILGLHSELKLTSVLEEKLFGLEQVTETLTNELEQFSGVQAIVNGTQKDAEDILREYSCHPKAVRQLATYCACLKRELLQVVQSKDKLADLNSKIESKNNEYASKIKFYEDALGVSENKFRKKAVPTANHASTLISENFSGIPSTSRQDALFEECLSPVSFAYNKNEFNMFVETPNVVYNSVSSSQTNMKFENMTSVAVKHKPDDGSFIRIQCKGGLSNFTSSGMRQIKVTKKM